MSIACVAFTNQDLSSFGAGLNLNCFPSLEVCKLGGLLLSGELNSRRLTTLECGFDHTRRLQFGNLPCLRGLKLNLQRKVFRSGDEQVSPIIIYLANSEDSVTPSKRLLRLIISTYFI